MDFNAFPPVPLFKGMSVSNRLSNSDTNRIQNNLVNTAEVKRN